MSSVVQNGANPMSRNMSYNDLKKRRMSRSMTNKGKLQAISKTRQMKNIQNQLLTPLDSTSKSRKLQSIYVNLNNFHVNKENQFSTQINNHSTSEGFVTSTELHKLNNMEKCPSNVRLLPKLETIQVHHGLKKTKSTRILTKRTITTCPVGKNIAETLRPVEEIKVKDIQNTIENEHLEKYQSVPQNSLRKSDQHIFLETLSPIKKKNEKDKVRQEQISGLSLIFEMQQENSSKINFKKNKEIGEVSQFRSEVFPEIQPKMPKIMRKHLPKDFFLRV